MLGTFPKDFSQVSTSQGYLPKWQLPKCANTQAATSQVVPSRSAWEVALGKMPMGKYITPWKYTQHPDFQILDHF